MVSIIIKLYPGPGHGSMYAWNPTWRAHHVPMWVKVELRKYALRKGTWKVGCTNAVYRVLDNSAGEANSPYHFRNLLDHWGSAVINGERVFIMQPYGEHDKAAADLAAELKWSVESFTPGPWNAGTWCYIFRSTDPNHNKR